MMRAKRLYVAMFLIILFLMISFFSEKKEEKKGEMTTIGILQYVSHPALDEICRGIQLGLKEEGYEEGKNIQIILQNGQADQSKLMTMSQQLVHEKKADLLIGIATPAAQSLANTTKDIPIILGAITDPLSANLVKDNEYPGGNITGVSDKSPVKAQFNLVTELLPQAEKVGILYSSAESNSKFQVSEAKKAAEEQGFLAKTYVVSSSNEIAQTVQVMASEVDVIYIPTDNTIANAMQTVVNEANRKNIPVIPSVDTMVEQGGLATIGINQFEIGVQTGKMAADILSGKSKTQNTPIYTFDRGETIINQKQAEKLGIEIPAEILSQAKIVN